MALGEVNQPINYGQPVNYLQDALLSGQTQAAMQQKYDVNTAKIEGMVEQISPIPIQQQAGKKYLMDKLQGVLNTVSANMKVSGGFGILSNSYTGGITSQIKGAIDDKVKKHIKYSADIINFEKGVAKLREKDPKLYNQANYDFAQYKAGLQNYLQGDENADLGSLQYNPYKDVFGDVTKKAMDIQKLKGKQTIKVPDPNDPSKMITTTYDGLSVEDAIKYIPGLLDAQDEQQMMIDGWNDIRYTKDGGVGELNSMSAVKREEYLNQIQIDKAKNSSNSNADELKSAKNRIKSYESSIAEIDENIKGFQNMPLEQRGYILKKAQMKTILAGAISANKSYETDINPIWKEEQDNMRADRAYALELDKHELAKAVAAKKKDANGNYVDDIQKDVAYEATTNQDVADMSPENIYTQVRGEYNRLYKEQKDIVLPIFGDLNKNSDEYKSFVANMKTSGFTLDSSGETFVQTGKKTVSLADALTVSFQQSGLSDNYPAEFAKLAKNNLERAKIGSDLAEVEASGTKTVKKGTIIGYRQSTSAYNDSPIPIYATIDSVELDKEKSGKMLQNKPGVKKVIEKNTLILSGNTLKSFVTKISPDKLEQAGFDTSGDKPVQVVPNKNGEWYDVTQLVSTDKDGKKQYATAKVPFEKSSASDMIKSMTQEKEDYFDVNEFKKGTILKPISKNRIADNTRDEYSKNIARNIRNQVKDPILAEKMVKFSKTADAEDVLNYSILTTLKDESSKGYAEALVNKVKTNQIISQLKGGNLGWYVEFTDANGKHIMDKQVSGAKMPNDVYNAVAMNGGQFTLSLINDMIVEGDLSGEDIQNLID